MYIAESRRCVFAPQIESLQRSGRQYTASKFTSQDYNSYEDDDKDCDSGFEWVHYAQQCQDIDECDSGAHDCHSPSQVKILLLYSNYIWGTSK